MKPKETNKNKIYTPEPPQIKYPLEKQDNLKDKEKEKKLSQINSIKAELLMAHSSLFFVLD